MHPESNPVLTGGRDDAASAVLVLHGGQQDSLAPTRSRNLAVVRMRDLYVGLRAGSRRCAVYHLRFRVRGWNASGGVPDPVQDARWALDQIAGRHGSVPVALLGHSMGARTAFAVADRPQVQGVCGLAPWLPDDEPLVQARADQRFVIAHGTADRITSAPLTLDYAQRLRHQGAAVARFELAGGKHSLLQRAGLWHRFAVQTTLGLAGDRDLPVGVAKALASEDPRTLRLPLADYA